MNAARTRIMVHMNTTTHSSNVKLRELIEAAGLTQDAALEKFNRGLVKPVSLSGFKAWLADPASQRWRRMDEVYVAHAEKAFKAKKKV